MEPTGLSPLFYILPSVVVAFSTLVATHISNNRALKEKELELFLNKKWEMYMKFNEQVTFFAGAPTGKKYFTLLATIDNIKLIAPEEVNKVVRGQNIIGILQDFREARIDDRDPLALDILREDLNKKREAISSKMKKDLNKHHFLAKKSWREKGKWWE